MVPASRTLSVFVLFLLAAALAGCSGGDGPVVPSVESIPPQNDSGHRPATLVSTDGPRLLWGLYTITLTPELELQAKPLRVAEIHVNVTNAILPPKCNYCLKLQKTGIDTSAAWISFNVSLANPTKLVGYDVRGIILGDEDYYLMNPDALTPYAGSLVYDPPNGFLAYATDQPNNAFPAGGNPQNPQYFTREFKIHIPPPFQQSKLLQIKYAVDASWPGNCPDPWYIGDLNLPADMFESTSYMPFTIDIFDHQNNITGVSLTAPAGWLGPVPTLVPLDADTWKGSFSNCENNPPGTYVFRLEAKSPDSSSPPKNLYLYRDLPVVIKTFNCSPDPKTNPSGAPKLALKAAVFDSLCEVNVRDYYEIDFNSASMPQLGVLSGDISVYSCFPGMKLDLVFLDQAQGIYYDSVSMTASGSGNVTLPVHIPNSVKVGEVERCFVRVRIPPPGTMNAPYCLVTNLTFDTTGCGDPVSISTVGAPDVPCSGGMVQGVLCEGNQMDWYRFDTLGPLAEQGYLTGNLTVTIDYPDPVPGGAQTSLSFRDEDGTLLANFLLTLPPAAASVDLADLDLPSRYVYYMCLNSPTQSSTPRYYRVSWYADIEQTCIDDSAAPPISPTKTAWDSLGSPGSSTRTWMCRPNDVYDLNPFTIPSGWSSSGTIIGGKLRVQTDPESVPNVLVSIGLKETTTGAYSWLSPVPLSGVNNLLNMTSLWQAPLDISGKPLSYLIRLENCGTGWATAQLETDLAPASGCPPEGDSQELPTGSVQLGGLATNYLSYGGDSADFWDLDWEGNARLKGNILVEAPSSVRVRLLNRGVQMAMKDGTSVVINVDSYDFGAGCYGPIVQVSPLSGAPSNCVQYYLSAGGLYEPSACESDPDGNDSLAEIQAKPWLWLSPIEFEDHICGVVCRQGGVSDSDVLGIAGQPFNKQGVLYGFASLVSPSGDGHEIQLVSMDGAMVLKSDNLTPPGYYASVELDTYNLPAIPPKGWKYHIVINPDPTGADSLTPYTCLSYMGINNDVPIDDGHDKQSEAWRVPPVVSRLGLLWGYGTTEDVDLGLPDMADWFRLEYEQIPGNYLAGTIKLYCEVEGITVRLMHEGEAAMSGTALYEATTSAGSDFVQITIPPATLPSVPAVGSHYYIVVHNNGNSSWAPFGLELNLTS